MFKFKWTEMVFVHTEVVCLVVPIRLLMITHLLIIHGLTVVVQCWMTARWQLIRSDSNSSRSLPVCIDVYLLSCRMCSSGTGKIFSCAMLLHTILGSLQYRSNEIGFGDPYTVLRGSCLVFIFTECLFTRLAVSFCQSYVYSKRPAHANITVFFSGFYTEYWLFSMLVICLPHSMTADTLVVKHRSYSSPLSLHSCLKLFNSALSRQVFHVVPNA